MSIHLTAKQEVYIADAIKGLRASSIVSNAKQCKKAFTEILEAIENGKIVDSFSAGFRCAQCGHTTYYNAKDIAELVLKYTSSLGQCPNGQCNATHDAQSIHYSG